MQGWEKGKGLGAKQTGIVNAIQVNWGQGGQGKLLTAGGGGEEEEQVVRKKRPGLSDSLTLVMIHPLGELHLLTHHSCRARRRRPSTTKCTNSSRSR